MNTRRNHSRRAFTLIEIMMALALFGLVVAAIYAVWMGIVRGSKVGLAAAAQAQRERVALSTIEEALTYMQSFNVNQGYYSFLAENGRDATLSFTARLPASFLRSGKFYGLDVRRLTFSLETGDGYESQLVLRQQPILKEIDEHEENQPLVLARNVKGMAFEFWDTQKKDWIEEWTQTNQIPSLVKVSLQFARPSGNYGYLNDFEEVTRIVAVPCKAVAVQWQRPGSGPGGAPGQPGAVPVVPGQPGQVGQPGQPGQFGQPTSPIRPVRPGLPR